MSYLIQLAVLLTFLNIQLCYFTTQEDADVLRHPHHKSKGKKQSDTCELPRPCRVSLPQQTRSQHCLNQRSHDISTARFWYQITDEKELSTIQFPLKQIPWLNQTIDSVIYYYSVDSFEGRYVSLFATWKRALAVVYSKVYAAFINNPFTDLQEYKLAYHAFQHGLISLNTPRYYSSPENDASFTNIVDTGLWKTDAIFTQTFLSSQCPWGLRKVTNSNIGMDGATLLELLNKNFDFNGELQYIYGSKMDLVQSIHEERLYVLYYEVYNDMETQPDLLPSDDTRTLMNVTSPIALFIRTNDGDLKVVAIQIDYKPTSAVYSTRSDNTRWLLAKTIVLQTHQDICQQKYHLGHSHFADTVFCLTFRRHFSKQHPIYVLMSHHCEGTVFGISAPYQQLLSPNSPGDQILAIGAKGATKLALDGYNERKYGLLAFDNLMARQGLDDDLLKYNPFRDDGKLLWNELKDFATLFVDMYYRKDRTVKRDNELQGYANELSANGKIAPDGGKGKVIGFPNSFNTKRELKLFITRFLWKNIFHSAVNYPISPAYMPVRATQLYHNSDPAAADSIVGFLPHAEVTLKIMSVTNTLSYFRANRLMDYYDKVQDKKYAKLVWKTYSRLNKCVQSELNKRNIKRQQANQLGMQYLEPKWLTNSVHI